MSLIPTAPSPIGGVLDTAIRLYRRSLLSCFGIILLSVAVMTAFSVLLVGALPVTAATASSPLAAFAVLRHLWLGYLVMLLVMTGFYGALFAQIDAIARGTRVGLGAALGIGLRRAPVMIGVAILFALMVGLGCVLLIVPGIYLWGVYQFAVIPPIVERAGVFESLSTSARLVKGNWWRSSTIMFVAFAILMVLELVIAMIAGITTAVSAGGAGAGAAAALTGARLVEQVASSILGLFTTSFFPCVLLAIYYDLKVRSEGTDLAARLGGLNPVA